MKKINLYTYISLLLIFISMSKYINCADNECIVDLSSLEVSRLPFIFKHETDEFYTIPENTLNVPHEDNLTIACWSINEGSLLYNEETKQCTFQRICKRLMRYEYYNEDECKIRLYLNFAECTTSQFFIFNSNATCTNGSVYSIGYYKKINSQTHEVNTINICLNNELFTPLYTHMRLNESVLGTATLESYLNIQEAESSIILNEIDIMAPMVSRVVDNEFLLKQLLNDHFQKHHITDTDLMELAYVVPEEDFPIMLKGSTKFSINKWLVLKYLKDGNWKRLENDIRNLAFATQSRALDIYTGSFGILQLPDDNRNYHPVYITDYLFYKKMYPLHEYIWKMVVDVENKSGIAFIALNKPILEINDFFRTKNGGKIFCEDICESIEWLHELQPFRNRLKQGYIYCCEIEEFKKYVTIAPNIIIDDVLIN